MLTFIGRFPEPALLFSVLVPLTKPNLFRFGMKNTIAIGSDVSNPNFVINFPKNMYLNDPNNLVINCINNIFCIIPNTVLSRTRRTSAEECVIFYDASITRSAVQLCHQTTTLGLAQTNKEKTSLKIYSVYPGMPVYAHLFPINATTYRLFPEKNTIATGAGLGGLLKRSMIITEHSQVFDGELHVNRITIAFTVKGSFRKCNPVNGINVSRETKWVQFSPSK